MSSNQVPARRRRIAAKAPRALPRSKKGASRHMDVYEIRAAAQTQLLRNPQTTTRELALMLGQPYVRVRDAVLGDDWRDGTGLSQFRWPDVPEQEAATG